MENRPTTVPYDLAEKLYIAALCLRDFIEMQSLNNPVIWTGDKKSRVIDMDHYITSCSAIVEFEEFENNYSQSKTVGAGQFSQSTPQPHDVLNIVTTIIE
jgi:hypothetical protein